MYRLIVKQLLEELGALRHRRNKHLTLVGLSVSSHSVTEQPTDKGRNDVAEEYVWVDITRDNHMLWAPSHKPCSLRSMHV